MKYYVQRTLVQVVGIEASNPETAEQKARELNLAAWFNQSIDTEIDYVVLDASGKVCG